MLLELKYNVYRPSRLTLKSWLFWNWKRHIHWLKNWCCFDFDFLFLLMWSKTQADICLLVLSYCKLPACENVLDVVEWESQSETPALLFCNATMNNNDGAVCRAMPSNQAVTPACLSKQLELTVKWPKATESFAKTPPISKLNGRVSNHWNLILKLWNCS